MLPTNVLYYGEERPLPARQSLRAGPLSLVFEEGDLRYIRLGDREILRRIYSAVRDRNWGTVPVSLSNLRVEAGADAFRITYDAENRVPGPARSLGGERVTGEIDFAWQAEITGDAAGTIRFSMEGQARSTFLRSRIGFCILHPGSECAGLPCTVEKVDGAIEQGEFPRYISPHQPFMDMRAISHEVAPGVTAEVRFAGDVFEMEDQRNWTDASFKTYCTPLALPYPVEIRAGDRVSQSVTLTLQGRVPTGAAEQAATGLTFSLQEAPAVPLPRIGLGVASHGRPLTQPELARLRALNLSHLRVDLRMGDPGWADRLRQAAEEARGIGAGLEVALHLSDAAEDELQALASRLDTIRPAVHTWLVFHCAEKSTAARWVHLARKHLSTYDPKAKFAAGTDAYFTELNRERPPVSLLDAVCYSINPQVHAFDNASLVETLEAQGSTVESARQFCEGKPIEISPVTLRPRFNPNATGPEPDPRPGELPAAVDPRQPSLFGAAWTLGSLKYLAESGASSVTYYETTGWRGVMETEEGSSLPERFRSLPGAMFPLYHVLADVGEFAGGEILPSRSSNTLQFDGLIIRKEGRTRTLVANMSPEAQTVAVSGLAHRVRVRAMDETNAEEAIRSPEAFRAHGGESIVTQAGELTVELRPYAVARIDST